MALHIIDNPSYLRRRKQLEESLRFVAQDIQAADAEMIQVENNQNGKALPAESTSGSGKERTGSNGSNQENGSGNELVIQSDDEISITSLNDQLFDKKVTVLLEISSFACICMHLYQ